MLALRPGGGDSIEPLRRAASVASARGAPDLAVTYLRRALAEPPPEADRVAILHELGMAEEMVVDEACLSHLVSARDGTLDPQARAARTIDLANAFAMLGRMPEAVTAIEDELADGHLVNDRARELLEAYVCALAWWNSDGNPRAQALLRRFPPSRPATQGPRGSRWRHVRHSLICRPGRPPSSLRSAGGRCAGHGSVDRKPAGDGHTHLCRRVRPRIRHAGAGTPASQA